MRDYYRTYMRDTIMANDTVPYSSIAKIYSNTHSGISEVIRKTGWMMKVTDLFNKNVQDRELFIKSLKNYQWYHAGTDANYTDFVPIYKISDSDEAFGTDGGFRLDPVRNVIKVQFGGETLDPSDAFERTYTLSSASCIRLKSELWQTGLGTSSGLQLNLFTGYTGLGIESML